MCRYVNEANCKTLVSCLVLFHLYYANTLYYGLPECGNGQMQRVQNMAAKLSRKNHDSASDCLKTLHWLSVKVRIVYKIAVYVFKCVNAAAPSYLI